MKFSVSNGTLDRVLSRAQNVVSRRPRIPILGNVVLSAGDRLEILASDADLTFRACVAAQVERPGSVSVPAHTLADISDGLPDDAVLMFDFKPDATDLKLEADGWKFTLPVRLADAFPEIVIEEPTAKFTIETTKLFKMLDKTNFAMSTEPHRQYLNGVHLHTIGKKLRAVATDSYQLALFETTLLSGDNEIPLATVPAKTVKLLNKLLNKVDETIDIAISPRQIQFYCGDVAVISRLVAGTFPAYERFIPNHKLRASAAVKPFNNALKRIASVSKLVRLTFEDGRLIISAADAEQGGATTEIGCDYQGARLEIGANARYLRNVAERIDGAKLQFELKDGLSPIVIKDGAGLFIVMPTRL